MIILGSMKKPALECPTCHGSGEIPLPETLSALLPILKAQPDSTVEDVSKSISDDITLNGVNNRLVKLLELGLVTRRRVGKNFHYSLSR